MSWVFISIIIATIIQIFTCGELPFTFLTVLATCIVRVMFCFRTQGVIFKIKPLFITEAFCVIGLLLYGLATYKTFQWLTWLLYTALTGVIVLLELYDDKMFVYVVEDYRED